MKIKDTDNITVLSINGEMNLNLETLSEKISKISKHLIIDFSEYGLLDKSQISILEKLSESHKNENLSFVIVFKDTPINNDELDIVPTLQEAFDYVEMDEIQRDLGFTLD